MPKLDFKMLNPPPPLKTKFIKFSSTTEKLDKYIMILNSDQKRINGIKQWKSKVWKIRFVSKFEPPPLNSLIKANILQT